ncbi:MAG: hypothetical protein M1269_11820 [Chloroflexi bacterium]|nr:hypothetical protein [Chloroflexota bacterium]
MNKKHIKGRVMLKGGLQRGSVTKLIVSIFLTAIFSFCMLNKAAAGTADLLPAIEDDSSLYRSYEMPGHVILQFIVPPDWKELIRGSRWGPPTIELYPRDSNDFLVVLDITLTKKSGENYNNPAVIRKKVEEEGNKLLEISVEKSLVIQELKGTEAIGYYYSITDKAPKPGEYTYMTQGRIDTLDFQVSFSIFFKDRSAPYENEALEMLKTARQR